MSVISRLCFFKYSLISLPYMSSPSAVISFELIPKLLTFSAIFLATPPKEIVIAPGFES